MSARRLPPNPDISDEIRDIAIIITDRLVDEGFIKNCVDTDDTTEFDVQDIIAEAISEWCWDYDYDLGAC